MVSNRHDDSAKERLLMRGVLEGDVERVASLLGSGPVPETDPPLLGLACRYAGLEMTLLLLKRSPACLGLGSHLTHWAHSRDYSRYLFRAGEVAEDASHEMISDAERIQVIRALVQYGEDADAILLGAALYADEELVALLEAQGVYFHPERILRSEELISSVAVSIRGAIESAAPKRAAKIIRLTRSLLGAPIRFDKETICRRAQPLDAHYCHPELFSAMCEHTNVLQIASRKQVFQGLLAARNEGAVRSLLKTKYFSGREQLERFLQIAREESPEEMGVQTLLMNRLQQIRSKRKSLDFSLDADPFSRRALAAAWTWKVLEDGTVQLNNYKGDSSHVVVPERVGKRPVSRLGAFAFSPAAKIHLENRDARKRIRTVIIPDGVRLGYGTFYACESLESVRLPAGLEEISPLAFAHTSLLLRLDIPESVRTIGSGAFYGSSVKELRFSDNLRELGPEAFESSRLERISLPAGVFSTKKVASTRENRKMTKMLPIGFGAFQMCGSLASVEFRGEGWIIPERLFYQCNSLGALTIPEGVETIEKEAFAGTALRSARFPASVTSVGDAAFRGAFALRHVVFESANVRFGKGVFEGCRILSDVSLPRRQLDIPTRTFCGCGELKQLFIPDTVVSVGPQAFQNAGTRPGIHPQ